ncbi:hypothetical protein [Phenylobacterium sp.]|uniref:hypothetical protein n=1 Tax=Phenylobacterium sp. TaxID=1871053 RepID=UPI003563BDEB
MTEDDLHGGDDAATNRTPEERVGLIPTWIVTGDDLNRAERANIAAGLRWVRHAVCRPTFLAGRLGREAFTWGRAELTDPGETRADYIAALKVADGFDLEPLVAFARL